jgi:hypothetical protein
MRVTMAPVDRIQVARVPRRVGAGHGPVESQPAASAPPGVGVDEHAGVDLSRTRKWPGMPTPGSGTPMRRPTSIPSTASVIGMPGDQDLVEQ